MSRFDEMADPDYTFMQSALGPPPPAPPDFDVPTIFLSVEGVLLHKEWDVRFPCVTVLARPSTRLRLAAHAAGRGREGGGVRTCGACGCLVGWPGGTCAPPPYVCFAV
jgi:hypothetical protein